mgnify:FL=1
MIFLFENETDGTYIDRYNFVYVDLTMLVYVAKSSDTYS